MKALRVPDGVLVGVTDFEDTLPAVKDPDEDAEGGRGLFLLSCLADELQTQPLLKGKCQRPRSRSRGR
ncbi:hypothetical protein [Streptomyces sp. ISL-86]|uniref:hypothetical protein n=1 Tax=Streptomyces sp. ISL-86 TaxID=2819187 RepID=UPI001BE56D56|nr:hypothetical protein [Streptomyces sp. ISL-86]MBT2457275.1 hypothetical protein [Streptomyces sp. ISL-86]